MIFYLEAIIGGQDIVFDSVENDGIIFVLGVSHGFETVSEHWQILERIVNFKDCFQRYEEATYQKEGED